MARLLVIAYYFPPLNTVGSLRPHAWAKFWTRAGHEVSVVTAAKSPRDGSLDLRLDPGVARACHIVEVPYRSVRSLRREIPPGKVGDRVLRPPTAGSRARSALRRGLRIVGIDPLSPHAWVGGAVAAARSLYQQRPFDAVVSTFGPSACHRIASRLRKELPVFWAADYRDLWSENHRYAAAWPFSRIERAIESAVVGRADLITTVTAPWRALLERRFGKPALTVVNGFDREDLLGLEPAPFFPGDGKLRLVYTGTYFQEHQSPEPLFEALASLRSRDQAAGGRFEVLFFGSRGRDLKELVDKYGLAGQVRDMGFLMRQDALRVQRDADLLIYLDWLDVQNPGVVAAKVFEYAFAGVPILCLGPGPDTSAARFIAESGTGVAVGMSVDAVSVILERLCRGEPPPYTPRQDVLLGVTREHLSNSLLAEILRRLPPARST